MIGRRSNKKEARRSEGKGEYKKQQSYHYSARRSRTDQRFDRREFDDDAKKPSSYRFQSLPGAASALLIIGGLLYLTTLSTTARIEVQGSTEFIGDQASVQLKADSYLRQSVINRLKPFFDETKMEEALISSFPEFSEITVKTYPFRHQPVAVITFGKPTLILTNGSTLYVVSDRGTILMDATKNKPTFDTTSLPLIQDQTSVSLEVGKGALTTAQVAYVYIIKFQAEQRNVKVETMIMTGGGSELHVKYAGQTYYVKYNFFEDARKSSGAYLAMKEKIEKENITPAEYVDVRIPERAYVK